MIPFSKLKSALFFSLLFILSDPANAQCTFSERDYLALNPDVHAAVLRGHFYSASEHYQRHGVLENRAYNRRCGPPSRSAYCPFVESEYLQYNLDVAAAVSRGHFRNGTEHFAQHGYQENRVLSRECAANLGRRGELPPSACGFNEQDYLALNPDVLASVMRGNFNSGREHFDRHGVFEGRAYHRSCGPMSRNAYCPFNEREYLELNTDVAVAVSRGSFSSGQDHFVQHGYLESRNLSYECARNRRHGSDW